MLRFSLALLLFLSPAFSLAGNYAYSPTYVPGYYYYPAGVYDGKFYQAGYYSVYYPQQVAVVKYVYQDRYIPVATYQPAYAPEVQLQAVTQVQQYQATAVRPSQAALLIQAAQVYQAQPHDCEAKLKALELRLEARFAAMMKAGVSGDTPAQPAPQLPPPKGALMRNCGSCHEASQASAPLQDGSLKGGGHVFFKDGTVSMTERQAERSIKLMLSGQMPPKQRLSDEEGQATLAELVAIGKK